MSGYVVIPAESARWRVDPAYFADSARRTWPRANIQFTMDPASGSLLTWEPEPGRDIMGFFLKDQQTIHLEGVLDACVDVALWYRKLVPPEHLLLFCDEDQNDRVELRLGTTRQQLIQYFLSSP